MQKFGKEKFCEIFLGLEGFRNNGVISCIRYRCYKFLIINAMLQELFTYSRAGHAGKKTTPRRCRTTEHAGEKIVVMKILDRDNIYRIGRTVEKKIHIASVKIKGPSL